MARQWFVFFPPLIQLLLRQEEQLQHNREGKQGRQRNPVAGYSFIHNSVISKYCDLLSLGAVKLLPAQGIKNFSWRYHESHQIKLSKACAEILESRHYLL